MRQSATPHGWAERPGQDLDRRSHARFLIQEPTVKKRRILARHAGNLPAACESTGVLEKFYGFANWRLQRDFMRIPGPILNLYVTTWTVQPGPLPGTLRVHVEFVGRCIRPSAVACTIAVTLIKVSHLSSNYGCEELFLSDTFNDAFTMVLSRVGVVL